MSYFDDQAESERLYHIVLRNDKTGQDSYMTSWPMPHHESTVMLGKMTPIAKSRPHLRYLLVDAAPTTNRYAKAGRGPAPSPIGGLDASYWTEQTIVAWRARPVKVVRTLAAHPHASGWHTYRLVQKMADGKVHKSEFFKPDDHAAKSYAMRLLYPGAKPLRLERARA